MRFMKSSTAFFPAQGEVFALTLWAGDQETWGVHPHRWQAGNGVSPRSRVFFLKIKPGWIRRKETMYTDNKQSCGEWIVLGVIFLDDLTWFYYYALHHITCATVFVNSPSQFPERRLSFYSLTPTPKGDCLFSKYRMRSKSLWFLKSDPLKRVT